MFFWLGCFAFSLVSFFFNFVVQVQVYFMKAQSLLGGGFGSSSNIPIGHWSRDGKGSPDWGSGVG